MDWETNAKAIRELWPEAVWNETLRDVWRKELEMLDQSALADALVVVKKNFGGLQPELKWVLGAYSTVQSERRVKNYRPIPRGEKHPIETPEESDERRLFQDWQSAISAMSVDEKEKLSGMVISSMDAGKLSARTTYILLGEIRSKCKEDT